MSQSLIPIVSVTDTPSPRRSFLRRLRPRREIKVLDQHVARGELTAEQTKRLRKGFGSREKRFETDADRIIMGGVFGLMAGMFVALATGEHNLAFLLLEVAGGATSVGAGARRIGRTPWARVIGDGPAPGSDAMHRKRYEVVFDVETDDGDRLVRWWTALTREISDDGLRALLGGSAVATMTLLEWSDQSAGATSTVRWRQELRLTDVESPIYPNAENLEMVTPVVSAWYDRGVGQFIKVVEQLNDPEQAPLGLHVGLGHAESGTVIGLVLRRLDRGGVEVDWRRHITLAAHDTFPDLPRLFCPQIEDRVLKDTVAGPFGDSDWAAAHEHVGQLAERVARHPSRRCDVRSADASTALEAHVADAARSLIESGRELT
jgi:hypothetical protein